MIYFNVSLHGQPMQLAVHVVRLRPSLEMPANFLPNSHSRASSPRAHDRQWWKKWNNSLLVTQQLTLVPHTYW